MLTRKFLPQNLVIKNWTDIESYYNDLSERSIKSKEEFIKWIEDRSELESVLEEDLAWRYIKMNCNTTDDELSERFEYFISKIEPHINKFTNVLDKKMIECEFINQLTEQKFKILIRQIKRKIDLFREENIPLIAELQKAEQEFGKVSSEMTINYDGEEMTLQKAANYLKNTNRNVREKVYRMINDRRMKEVTSLNVLFTRLIKKRQQIAQNAGYEYFSDYKFDDLGRFDYTKEDCFKLHDSISENVLPILDKIYDERKQALKLNKLKPWDLSVDIKNRDALKPFTDTKELITKTIECYNQIDTQFGGFIKTMSEKKYFDLDSRKGKAPGGFNYPLYESDIPFIYMNATGNMRDLTTMLHEGGHAIHSFLSAKQKLVGFKSFPSEVAELASMSMELIAMEHFDVFFKNKEELKRAKKEQLEDVIMVLPWIATIDKFQYWVYENPSHSVEDRMDNWTKIAKQFTSKVIDWETCEWYFVNSWQKQLHIFEVPFYYIEYGMAQLGAIAIWRNYKNNPKQTIEQYKNALELGYTKTIPEIYKTAGIEFNFSSEYIGELMNFVLGELTKH